MEWSCSHWVPSYGILEVPLQWCIGYHIFCSWPLLCVCQNVLSDKRHWWHIKQLINKSQITSEWWCLLLWFNLSEMLFLLIVSGIIKFLSNHFPCITHCVLCSISPFDSSAVPACFVVIFVMPIFQFLTRSSWYCNLPQACHFKPFIFIIIYYLEWLSLHPDHDSLPISNTNY